MERRILAALYERLEDAEAARAELVAREYSTDRVHLTSCGEVGRGDDGSLRDAQSDTAQRIGDFFRSLFESGRLSDRMDFFTERVLAGKVAVSVQLREHDEADEVERVLRRHGPIEIHRDEGSRPGIAAGVSTAAEHAARAANAKSGAPGRS